MHKTVCDAAPYMVQDKTRTVSLGCETTVYGNYNPHQSDCGHDGVGDARALNVTLIQRQLCGAGKGRIDL